MTVLHRLDVGPHCTTDASKTPSLAIHQVKALQISRGTHGTVQSIYSKGGTASAMRCAKST